MLVNHPQMLVSELPPEATVWHTLPTSWGRLLTERMGPVMTFSPKYMHWYAKLDGHCIHIRRCKENANHFWIEHIATDTEAVSTAIQQELNNGIIITATTITG